MIFQIRNSSEWIFVIFEPKEIPDRPSELKTSLINKPKFRRLVYHELNERLQVPEKELLDSASESLDMSQVTAKRYMDGMCSNAGMLQRKTVGKTVAIQYKPEMPLIWDKKYHFCAW